jgi:two-component system LytT family sensor kinase
VSRSPPLLAILSAIALGASIVRAVAQWQLVASFGGPLTARTLVLLETGNWLGWSAWAVLLVRATARLDVRPRPETGARLAIVAFALLPMLVVPLLTAPWHALVTDSAGLIASATHIAGHNLPTNLLLGVVMAGVAYGRRLLDRSQRLERTAVDLRAQLAEAQLATLRAQLDPHFLFNALNSVSVLARRGEMQQVERMIARLAGLLRHSLDAAGAQLVPLRTELEALRHYLEIEQVRHGERLAVRWEVPASVEGLIVPSFILQPLVENAIRHGFDDPERALTVAVAVEEGDGRLRLIVQDDGAGLSARGAPADGIGLGHTKARLAALHGDAASLELGTGREGRGVRVTISLPLAPPGSR